MGFEVAGSWRGRLVDIRGYEGFVTLRLDQKDQQVGGIADVALAGTHATERFRVRLAGQLEDEPAGRIVLRGLASERAGVEFGIEGVVFEQVSGGLGLRGTYEVVAKGFSPLRAGALSASTGVATPSREVVAREPAEVA